MKHRHHAPPNRPAGTTSRVQTAFVAALDRLLEPLENLQFEPLENSQEEQLQNGSRRPGPLAADNARPGTGKNRGRVYARFRLLRARVRSSQRSPYRQIRAVLWFVAIGLVASAFLWWIEHMA